MHLRSHITHLGFQNMQLGTYIMIWIPNHALGCTWNPNSHMMYLKTTSHV